MKKSLKILSVVLILTMIFSFTAFAAKDEALTITSVTSGGKDLEGSKIENAAVISIVFSNNVTDDGTEENALLINNSSKVKVKDASGKAAKSTVAAGADKQTIDVTLGGIDAGDYTLEIGKELKAKNGTELGEKKVYSFKVKGDGSGNGDGSGGGNNPLTVTSITVSGNNLSGADLKGNETITVVFDRGMTENEEANKALICVKKEDGTKAEINIGKVSDKSTETIELKDLEPGKYTLVLGKDIKANNGNTLGQSNDGKDYTVDFTVRIAETTCECWCHETGIKAILWQIYIFFCELFNLNPVCECGAAHY